MKNSLLGMDENEERAWRGLVLLHHKLFSHLERELIRRNGLSEPDFAVLMELLDAPEERIRFSNLRDNLGWQKSRLSKQISRMVSRGLVEKLAIDSDGRGVLIALTPEGQGTILGAIPKHYQDVRQWFIDSLSSDQLESIAQSSQAILANLPAE